MAVHREETPDRASRWLIVALAVSAAFWMAIGIIVLALLQKS
jgi:hypothetical protein